MLIPVADYARTIKTVMDRLSHSRNVNVDTYISDAEATIMLPTLTNHGDKTAVDILVKAKLEQAIGLSARAVVTGVEAGYIHDIFKQQQEQ